MKIVTRLYMMYLAGRMRKSDDPRLMEQMGKLPLNITIKKDIPYLNDGISEHMMDLYYPENMDPVMLPTIVNIHGGCFIYGRKEINQAYNMQMAQCGFAVISLNYRLVPKVNLLGQIQDIMKALHHIEENTAKYPCNPDWMFLTGDSAGAFLALYTYVVNRNERIARAFGVEGTSLTFRALGFISGMFFTHGTSIKNLLKHMKTYLFPKNYLKMGFYPYMNMERLLQACELVPCYMQTSREDHNRVHTLEFEVMLARRGVCHKLHDWEKYGSRRLPHKFPVIHPEWEESHMTVKEMASFFQSQCGKEFEEPV